jgi:formylglycine-generating enzyme required for sulfatase activity
VAGPIDVFISHAQADRRLCGELEMHLAGLEREGVLRTWSEQRIAAGDDRRTVVEARLTGAGVVLVLVSADYIASDDLYQGQMRTALARAHAGDARVIPVLLHACEWTLAGFEGLTPLPPNGKPVSLWENRHEAWTAVTHGIRKAIADTATPVVAPEPAYESAEIRALAEQIERARQRKAALEAAGESTEAIDEEILALRRRLREGGQLRAGDALGDGRYTLLRTVGRGGFGAVWAAHDRTQGEQVAIKVLHPSQAREASRRERFFRGARVMGSLLHEGVVRVLEPRGEDGGYFYFVMELVAGNDLHRTVLEKRLRPEDVVPLILRVAEALGEAHARGIVHRDVKPANVVLDASGMPKLTDFDLVAVKDTTGGTRTGALGTLMFSAPEQMNNAKEADARADVYGLGMTALFCLYGEELPPIVTRKPERVIAALPGSDAVKAVVTRAIELEPEKRYTDARAFCEALQAAMPVVTRPVASNPISTKLAAGMLAVLTAAAVVRWMFGKSLVDMPHVDPVVPVMIVCPAGTVPVPGGTFIMGSADGKEQEKPPHQVKLSTFCIDKTEVTVADYRQCTKEKRGALQCTVPKTGGSCNWDKTDRDTHPINCVDWAQADAYCTWAGGSLPSEAQWEYAARGSKGVEYPWGEAPPGPSLLNACDSECAAAHAGFGTMYEGDDKWPETAPVGTYPAGASPFGALDMAGNVWEWVADEYAPSYPAEGKSIPEDPKGPVTAPESRRVIRGGGWNVTVASWVRAASRSGFDVSARNTTVGFRCARGQKL